MQHRKLSAKEQDYWCKDWKAGEKLANEDKGQGNVLREEQHARRNSLMEVPKSWSEDQPCVVTVVIDLAPSVGRRIRIIRQLELADIEKCCEAQSARQCLWQQMGRIWAWSWQSCFQMSLSRYFWYWWSSANAIGRDNLPSQGQHFSSCSYRVFFCQLESTKQSFSLMCSKASTE